MAVTVEPNGGSARIGGVEVWVDPPPSDASCWLLFALPCAFLRQQPIEMAKPVDDSLLAGAKFVLHIWAGSYKKNPVPIIAPAARSGPRNGRRAAFFTGGVDSFFTAIHRDVDDLIYVDGFDIPLDRREFSAYVRADLEKAAAKLGKRLVTVTSNVREALYGKKGWAALQHGAALAGIAAALRYEKTYIASTYGLYGLNIPQGSHALTDPYLGLFHDGVTYSRAERTAVLAKHPVAIEHLRVCYSSKTAPFNCSECVKCRRTMTALHLLGVRGPTFDWSKFRLRDVARTYMADKNDAALAREMLTLPGDSRTLWAIRASIAYSGIRRLFDRQGAARLPVFEPAANSGPQPSPDAPGGLTSGCGTAGSGTHPAAAAGQGKK